MWLNLIKQNYLPKEVNRVACFLGNKNDQDADYEAQEKGRICCNETQMPLLQKKKKKPKYPFLSSCMS
jgi:hypothetical protein